MVQYDKKIVNKLLDTYENSLLSTNENKRRVNIEFRFTKSALPEYFNESSFVYEDIHIQMRALEEQKIVQIIWKDGKENYVIQKVRLNIDWLEQAYAFVHRIPRRNLEEENKLLLAEYDNDTGCEIPITRKFIHYLLERLQHHQSVKQYIHLDNPLETKHLLIALTGVERNRKPCYVREFSIAHFQDSKIFEQLESHVVKIFRRFHPQYKSMDAREILAEYGIYHTPNYVYFKGNIVIAIDGEPMKLRHLNQGVGISGEDLENIAFKDLSRIKRVLTIENLTTFFRWNEPDSLIIYLGGYHNRIRRALLEKIHRAIPKVEYYHFGDIDAGGFAILKDLRNKTGIHFQMYHMELQTLKSYEQYGKPLSESDRSRLKEMAKEEEFREVISYMLSHDVKLEQECIG
ncbi:MAG: DUF2220 family protein [Eubacteriales bacterium]|nr:DUF2220 family protein [Eubacteriales bacterium]